MKCTSAPGASLGILLLALLKGAASVPVSYDGAIAILDLGESRGSSYSKRVTLAVTQWARETQNCSTKDLEISYENECIRLADLHFTPSCPRHHWLVLEKPKKSDQGRYFPVKPKCVRMPCEISEVWWDPLQKCIPKENAFKICNRNQDFTTDPFGDVFCGCSSIYGQLSEGADCHEYYQQGPCKSDEVLVFDAASALGKCAPDVCFNKNKLVKVIERKPGAGWADGAPRKLFAPLNGTGPCQKSGSPNDCDVLFEIMVDEYAREFTITACGPVSAVKPQTIVQTCQNFDPTSNECPGEVKVEPGPQQIYDNANRGPFNQ